MKVYSKAQFSMEYLLTIVFVSAIFIPIILYAYASASEKSEEVEAKQMETLGNFFLTNIEKVYGSGVPSRITAKQRLPIALKNITVGGPRRNDVVFQTESGREYAFSSNYPLEINLTRALSPGIIAVRFDAVYNSSSDQVVNITLLT